MVLPLTWVLCLGSFFVTLYLIQRHGLLEGGGLVWVICLLLVPTWMTIPLNFVTIDARSLCASAILIGFLRQPYGSQPSKGWYFSDLFVLAIIVGMTITQISVRNITPVAPFDHFREFGLPYIVGRLFLKSASDIEKPLPVFSFCILVISIYAIVEGITKVNPIELLLGRDWYKGADDIASVRFGLKRAYAVQTHPIYFGLTLAMTLPWAIEAAVLAWNGRGPRWWQLVPLFSLAGIFCTGSRAAQLCALATLATTFYFSAPRLRPGLLFLLALGGIGFFLFREQIVTALENYADESADGVSYVKINGEQYEYSGTKHRDLLDIVYKEAIENAGWFGYGTMMSRAPKDFQPDERFNSIDNHYLMFYLQYGYLGWMLFGFLAVSVLWNLLPSFLYGVGPPGRFAAGLFGAIGGCLIAMRGVWFSPDFASVWLFSAGISVSLAHWYSETLTGAGVAYRV